jgi:hypothetical protein
MITLFDRKGNLGMRITIGSCFPFDIVPLPLVDAILSFVCLFNPFTRQKLTSNHMKPSLSVCDLS